MYGDNMFVEKEEPKQTELVRVPNPVTVELGIQWLEFKIKELGGKLEDPEEFREEMRKFIKKRYAKIGTCVIFTHPNSMKPAFKKILEEQGVLEFFKNEVISLTIGSVEVLVADGYSQPRKRVRFSKQKEVFEYDCVSNINVNTL